MERRNIPNISIENANIFYKNFAGAPTKFNPRAGSRSFCVYIDDPDTVEQMLQDGWNLKTRDPRDEGDPVRHYLQVAVSFDGPFPPKVVMVTRRKQTPLDAESVEALDYAEIVNVDLSIRPYEWEVNGKTGVKAYLKTMYVTVEEDEFAAKYDNLPFM